MSSLAGIGGFSKHPPLKVQEARVYLVPSIGLRIRVPYTGVDVALHFQPPNWYTEFLWVWCL